MSGRGSARPTVAVLGGTGRVGSLVVRALLARGADVRVLARDEAKARAMFDVDAARSSVDVVGGDLDDRGSLDRLFAGTGAAFIASPVSPRLLEQQCAAIEAARASGVARLVKLSGSAWTMGRGVASRTGAAHAEIERVLARSGADAVALRPGAFAQGVLGRIAADLRDGDAFALALGAARVAFIDVRDIADVAAASILDIDAPPTTTGAKTVHAETDEGGGGETTRFDAAAGSSLPAGRCRTWHLTAAEALGGSDIAGRLSERLSRPIRYRPISIDAALERARRAGADDGTLAHQREVLALMAAGAAAEVGDDIARVLGRPPRDALDLVVDAVQTDGPRRTIAA